MQAMDPKAVQSHYDLREDGQARVAGRLTQVLLIEPKDGYRFGYRLALDKETALPLRAEMFDGQDRRLSHTLFTHIKIGSDITPIEQDIAALQLASSAASEKTMPSDTSSQSWHFHPLPKGYRLNTQRLVVGPDNRSVQHYVFTDGLASLSVYVETGEDPSMNGGASMGATQAYGRSLNGHQLTAVGEVPQTTLKLLLDNAKFAND